MWGEVMRKSSDPGKERAGSMRVRFGGFLFDGGRRELLRSDEAVHLSPKAFRLLEALIERAPTAVSKEELYDVLWPDVLVEEANLKNLVAEVRRALGEDARKPRFLRTVFGFGYSFRLEGSPVPSGRLRLTYFAREFELLPGENVLGREGDVAVMIPHKSVSRRHARIFVRSDNAVLEDLGSKNGTWLNGRSIEAPAELADGDEIRLGSAPLVFRARTETSTETNVPE
jgi:DNA-binding winged helix-turn-helix (wHTH) protein